MIESPPRLRDDPEVGPLLRVSDAPGLSPSRLADNAAGLRALIAASATTAWWKLAIGLLLLTGAVATLVYVWTRAGEPVAPPPDAGRQLVTMASTDAGDAGDAGLADGDLVDAALAQEPAPDAALQVAITRVPRRVPVDAGVVALPPPDASAAATSDLPEQIRLYEDARDASRQSKYAVALDRLDELARRFPASPLAADASLTRADVLARARRLPEAILAFEALVIESAHRGRRGDLLKTLGDLYRQAKDCPRAIDAYTRAKVERLSPAQAADVARGLERCADSKGRSK